MTRTITEEQYNEFMILIDSDIDRYNEYIPQETDPRDKQDLINARERLINMKQQLIRQNIC